MNNLEKANKKCYAVRNGVEKIVKSKCCNANTKLNFSFLSNRIGINNASFQYVCMQCKKKCEVYYKKEANQIKGGE